MNYSNPQGRKAAAAKYENPCGTGVFYMLDSLLDSLLDWGQVSLRGRFALDRPF